MIKTRGGRIFNILNNTFMVILAVVFIYPFWYTLVLSFSTPLAASELGLKLFPSQASIEAYKETFQSNLIYIGYLNTFIRVIMGTALTVFFTYCGAYVLSKKNLPFRGVLTILILFTMFFSGGLIPSYLLVKNLGLIDSRWSLILPCLTNAWYLIIARNFIMTIPESMEESAFVDGAGPLTVIFRIIFPLSMPIIAVLILWTAVTHWNAWFDAYIYIRDNAKMVLQLVLRRVLIDNQIESGSGVRNIMTDMNSRATPETIKAAIVILSIAPIVALYPFLQKYFVKGILVGALKG